MAVDNAYFPSVVDVPLQRLLQPAPDQTSYRKWLRLLPVFLVSAIAVGLVLWGVFIAADLILNGAADVHNNLN